MSKVLIVMVADSLPSLRIFRALQPVAQKLFEAQRFEAKAEIISSAEIRHACDVFKIQNGSSLIDIFI